MTYDHYVLELTMRLVSNFDTTQLLDHEGMRRCLSNAKAMADIVQEHLLFELED